MARRPKAENSQLASLLIEAGLSNKGLAARVVRLGAARGYELHYNHSSVARWLRGERPRSPTPELIAEILSAALGRPMSTDEIGMCDQGKVSDAVILRLPERASDSGQILGALTRDDLEQRRQDTGFDATVYSSAALRWIVAPRTAMPAARGFRALGWPDVADIREATRAFRVLDNRMAGGKIRPSVVDYLHDNVVPLLHHARCTEDVRKGLFSAAAELCQLAGWLAYDLEWQGVAQRYLVQALSMARFAEDDTLGGEILAAMSHQAIWVSQPAHAIDLAQTAQTASRRVNQPVLETESLVMEAHAHALRGESRDCSRALRRASEAYDKVGPEPPPWLRYFDDAYFAARIAHCFRALGQGSQTEKYALRSLDMDGRFLRGKAFNVALLASGYAAQEELEEACNQGRQAVDRVVRLDSMRAITYIRNLLVDLSDHEDVKLVRDFRTYAESQLPALRRRA